MSHAPIPEPNTGLYAAPRRTDRAVADVAWLRAFLQRAPVGVLATVQAGQPFVNSNLFVYDAAAHCLYLHTAKAGRTREAIAAHPRVCFSVMEMGRLLPAELALEFSVEYASVVIFGSARIIDDTGEATRGLQLLLEKYAPHLTPGTDYCPPVESELKRTTVIRVEIEEWSGKKKEVAPDFPGAFWYDAPPMLASLARRDR
jgi:nitroimidazol reductase NimA-like FMN-containing flavoprotein (pyridoxamine 5'-phosphate oxidase superfamily)